MKANPARAVWTGAASVHPAELAPLSPAKSHCGEHLQNSDDVKLLNFSNGSACSSASPPSSRHGQLANSRTYSRKEVSRRTVTSCASSLAQTIGASDLDSTYWSRFSDDSAVVTAARSCAVSLEQEACLEKQLSIIMARLLAEEPEGEESANSDILSSMAFEFDYKQRVCTGSALHVSALHAEGEKAVRLLLERRADIEDECLFQSFDREGRAQAIHLCTGRGNLGVLQLLLDASANVDAKTNFNGVPNYTALHEAAFFHQADAAKMLLRHRATVDVVNCNGQTPLYIAAMQGAAKVAQLLVVSSADLQARDQRMQHTPLMAACEFNRFPHKRLHILARRNMEDVLLVARFNPNAASEMMRDRNPNDNGRNAVHESWGRALLDSHHLSSDQGLDEWATLLSLAPQAAVDLLNAIVVEPEVDSEVRHPLPKRARLHKHRQMRCCYVPDKTWSFVETAGSQRFPEWHNVLAPGQSETWLRKAQPGYQNSGEGSCARCCWSLLKLWIPWIGRTELVSVKVKHLLIPGILNAKVLHALASTEHLQIFASLPVQAIVQCCWRSLVKRFYYANILYRMTDIAVLMFLVAFPPGHNLDLWRRASWSFLLVGAGRELFYEASEVYGYVYDVKKPWTYLANVKNAADIGSILLLLFLAIQTSHDQDMYSHPQTLAIICFWRWFQLCYAFRAFPWAGHKLMPILMSFWQIGGILLITVFVGAGFLHAFLVLESSNPSGDKISVMLGTFRLLFIGDGDGIDTVLGLGGVGPTGDAFTRVFLFLSVTVFCICILNLFIAVHGEAYDAAQERSTATFLQERASVCLQCLLRPHLPSEMRCWRFAVDIRHRSRTVFIILAMSSMVWAALIQYEVVHPAVPSLVLFVAVLVGDAIHLQRPWRLNHMISTHVSGKLDLNHLWICHRADFDEGKYWPVDATNDLHEEGRLTTLKKDNMLRSRRLGEQMTEVERSVNVRIESLERSLDERTECLRADLSALGERFGRMEHTMDALVQELRRARLQSQNTQVVLSNGSPRISDGRQLD